ncbi:MAG: DUF2207 domain-containing protein [Clostridia bacterium]|nr:DUF2207 domain-containing protein [Clostridia bacterium]
MKKLKICLMMIITIMVIGITKTVSADLKLNSLEFEANIKENGDMEVVEYWNIKIEDTNTLYKYFKRDNTKFSGIEQVVVTDITNGKNVKYVRDTYWQYHVAPNHYYGTFNNDRNFEIGWGVGLENQTATRKYKIEYIVKDAITKNNDYAELYWQFIGNGFEVPAKEVKGKIALPQEAESKEKIKVWGHTEELNGEIYATSNNTVEFQLDGYNSGNMLEVRVLFPTEMITQATRQSDKEILQEVIDEETKWVEEANARRLKNKMIITLAVVIVSLIIDIVIIMKIKKYNKKQKNQEDKYVPENKIEYFRDIPRNNATPGEAYRLINESISEIQSSNIGKIFSAGLLDLSLKGYVEFEINEQKKKEVIIKLTGKQISETEEIREEKNIYEFLKNIKNIENGITVKELQKAIEKYPSKIEKLIDNINKQISKGLKENKLIDEKEKDEYSKYTSGQVLYFILLVWYIIAGIFVLITESNIVIQICLAITVILIITGIVKSMKIAKRINVFTQEGVNEIEEWKGLKKYMKDYSLLHEKEVPAVTIWEKYLVFATAFGIASEVIKQLKLVYPEFEDISTINSTTLFIAMNTDFSRTFSNAINTSISTTYSSSTGGGGGFSGGGGGGRRTAVEVEDVRNNVQRNPAYDVI